MKNEHLNDCIYNLANQLFYLRSSPSRTLPVATNRMRIKRFTFSSICVEPDHQQKQKLFTCLFLCGKNSKNGKLFIFYFATLFCSQMVPLTLFLPPSNTSQSKRGCGNWRHCRRETPEYRRQKRDCPAGTNQ